MIGSVRYPLVAPSTKPPRAEGANSRDDDSRFELINTTTLAVVDGRIPSFADVAYMMH